MSDVYPFRNELSYVSYSQGTDRQTDKTDLQSPKFI